MMEYSTENLVTALVVGGILAACAALCALAWWSDTRDARRTAREFEAAHTAREQGYGAELFAAAPETYRRTADDVFREKWDKETDAYLKDLNARFEQLLAGMPTHDDEALPDSYWPSVAPVTGAPTYATLTDSVGELAEFAGPEGGLKLIERENGRPAAYPPRVSHLWTTGAYPMVSAPVRLREEDTVPIPASISAPTSIPISIPSGRPQYTARH